MNHPRQPADAARATTRTPRRDAASGTPWPLRVPAGVAVIFLLLPLIGMILLAPWRRLPEILTDPITIAALRLSVITATVSTLIALVVGVPLAWVLARSRSRAVRWVRPLVTLPLVLPPVVGGVALLLAYGRNGIAGRWLYQALGWQIPFTSVAVVLAQTFVAMPFLVVTVEGALRSVDPGLEEAAQTLGSRPFPTFYRVTLPLVLPSVAAGGVLTWARALGEFGATITFAGNLPEVTQTMPSAVYQAFETDPDAAIVLSLVLLSVSVTVLLMLRPHWLRRGGL